MKKLSTSNAYLGSAKTRLLHLATHKGFFEVFQVIASKVDDCNPKSADGTTPLHITAKNGNIELCQLIVDKLEDQGRDEDYETPYTLAVRNNHPEIVKMLIDKVDNPNPESTGMYLFYPYAASGGAICLARRLNSLSATANISKNFFSELTYNTDQDPF